MKKNVFKKKYVSILSMRETQEAQELILNSLKSELINNFNLLIVRSPKISSTRQSVNFSSLDGRRPINFDSSNNSNIYYIFNKYKYWFINTMKKLEIKNNQGIISEINFIDRDSEITNIKSMENNTLQIEYRFDNKEEIENKAIELFEKIYSIILNIENVIHKKYNIPLRLPKKIKTKELNKMVKNNSQLEENKAFAASENFIYNLINRINSNEIKYDYNFELTLESYSKEIDSSFSIFKIKDRKTLEDLKPFIYKSDRTIEEYRFSKEILNNEDVRTLNIKIDIDLLSMVLLRKTHILELQSGKNSDEIEKILNSFVIKHL